MRRILSSLLVLATLAPAISASSAGRSRRQAAALESSPTRLPFRTHPDDELTRAGFDCFYNMDYDGAIRLFREELQRRPDDPFVVNHLLFAILAKELNREGALDATLYVGNRFEKMKEQPVNPQVKEQIASLSAEALNMANAELAKNPDDVNALYARAIARGLAAVYTAIIEKHWLGALRQALGAYHDEYHILKLDPNYSDAKFIVGGYQYIVGSLSWYEKAIAFVVDIRGNKEKGLRLLRECADGGGESSTDAKTMLALFLAREKRYAESIAIVRGEYADFPHNFMFGLAVADLLRVSGRQDAAIAAYRQLVNLGERGFFPGGQPERAALALGDALRQEGKFAEAAAAFDQASNFPHANSAVASAILARASLEAGEMYDLLGQRQRALSHYKAVLLAAPGSDDARSAAAYLHRPFSPSEAN